MVVYIKCYRKSDGSWEGKVKINLKQLWYLKMNEKLNGRLQNFELKNRTFILGNKTFVF